jgi:hypothetical protein
MIIGGKDFTRRDIERRTGSLHQIGGTRHSTLSSGRSKGVHVVEFNTGTGFSFTVVPDRGLDIADCTYRGLSLVYLTPGGITHPAFYEPVGFGWLRTFFGGLLTTCGLTYFGNPGRDGDDDLGLHGRYSTLPADRVCDRSRWEGDSYILEVNGEISESSLFGEKITLQRSIRSEVGKSSLVVRDSARNVGFSSAPFCLLYHVNAGFPLLDAQSELVLSSQEVYPYDSIAEAGLDDIRRFGEPSRGFQGQDYLHTMKGDKDGYAAAALVNRTLTPNPGRTTKGSTPGGMGLFMKFNTSTLPFLNEWKMLGEGDYVLGIEPVNTIILNRAELKSRGRLPMLEPGEVREMELELGVLEGQSEINRFVAGVESIGSGSA